ncbi:MAG TPA: response regulator transcription factor [Dehalococcoidia bacterium]|nr:response regulator transcription factor [Dehalococcoidia bacterium]
MAEQRILVVDDDVHIRDLVRRRLAAEGYEVVTAIDGRQALERLKQALPHLAIVDLRMPGMDGFELCRQIKTFGDVPVILLTGVNDPETKVAGLDAYAEDYVTKPFDARELIARVRRVLARFGQADQLDRAEITIDDRLRISLTNRWIERDGERIPLTPTEARLLHILLRNRGQVVATETLLARAWGPAEEVFAEGLRVHIRRLRAKLEPDANSPRYLLTERGAGYRFARPDELKATE